VAVTVPAAVMAIGMATPVTASAAPREGAASAPGPVQLVVGTQTLDRCASAPLAYCGRLAVPLDRSEAGSPDITIAYRWYPATRPDGAPAGTLLPVEGGPGYPSAGSVVGGYDVMYRPLLADWNLLAVDLRGTGSSTPLDCPGVQDFSGQPSGPVFAAAAGTCGASLDHRWRYASGAYVHASDLFTSATAAADVAEVIRALDVPTVDLYGDSYGSWFAQVFANHYPDLIRSVVLDSTYSTVALDPWYRSTIDDMPADFDDAYSRSPSCAAAEDEPAWSRISSLATVLARHPARGVVPDATGRDATVTMGVVGLVDLVNDAAGDPDIYRSLDAAARALLTNDDPDPLLRLYAQRLAYDENYIGSTPSSYSADLYLAVSCLDYPQLFSMADPPAARRAELAASVAALAPGTFAPFTTAQWLRQDQNTEAYTACTSWPSPVHDVPPTTGTLPLLPAGMPVVVLGGEFDTWTPPSDHPAILQQLGGDSRFVEFANSTHVVGEGDQPCASTIVRTFVEAPSSLATLDTSCAAEVAPIRSIGEFPDDLAQVTPLQPGPGDQVTGAGLELGAAAVATAGDAVHRESSIGAVRDTGLHGGTVTPVGAGRLLRLDRVEFVPGVAVTGTVVTTAAKVVAQVTVTGPHGTAATVSARWASTGAGAVADVSGSVGGRVLVGTSPAP
jgi:pimeloyl-ACP methyl ester carboxylesterase